MQPLHDEERAEGEQADAQRNDGFAAREKDRRRKQSPREHKGGDSPPDIPGAMAALAERWKVHVAGLKLHIPLFFIVRSVGRGFDQTRQIRPRIWAGGVRAFHLAPRMPQVYEQGSAFFVTGDRKAATGKKAFRAIVVRCSR